MKIQPFFTLLAILLLVFSGRAQKDSLLYVQSLDAYSTSNYSQALKLINSAMAISEKDSFYVLKAEICYELKDYKELGFTMKGGLEKFPDSYKVNQYYGNMLLLGGMPKEAVPYFSKCLDIADGNEEEIVLTLMNRAAAYMHYMNYEDAYNDLKEALELDSTNPGIIINLGAVCDNVNKQAEGIEYMKKALTYDLDTMMRIGVLANLGFQYQKMSKHHIALDYYNQVLTLDPNEAVGYSNRSFSRLELGDVEGALEDVNKSIKLNSNNSYAYMNRGKVYLKMNKSKKACEDFEKAIELGFSEQYGDEVQQLMYANCR